MLKIYRFINIICWFFIVLYLFYRQLIGKEEKSRLKERFGYPSVKKYKDKLIWIHAASVGESISVLPLIEQLIILYTEYQILITTGTVTSSNLLIKKLPTNVNHQYIVVDDYFSVKRFLNYWQPDLAIFTESEIWPNLVDLTKGFCPLILINARISLSSYRIWSLFSKSIRILLKNFDLIIAQSSQDKILFNKLGAKNLAQLENLKFSSKPLFVDQTQFLDLGIKLKERIVFVAASTHPGEEEQLAKLYDILSKKYQKLILIIIPRHSTRTPEIINNLLKINQDFNIAIRSKYQQVSQSTDFYLADTMGELGLFYKLADLVFIGGSLIPIGGHNAIEALHFDCAITIGSYTFKCQDVIDKLREHHAIKVAKNIDHLIEIIDQLLSSPLARLELAQNAKKIANSNHLIIPFVINQIDELLQE